MSERGVDARVLESLTVLAKDFAALDGREGKGGGLVVRAPNRWMALTAWLMRGYVIVKWLRNSRIPLEQIQDAELRQEYAKFVEKSIGIVDKLERVSAALAKTEVGHEIASWYEDEEYWECALSVAGFAASVYVGDALGALGFGMSAYEECGEYLDSVDRGDERGDDGRRDDN